MSTQQTPAGWVAPPPLPPQPAVSYAPVVVVNTAAPRPARHAHGAMWWLTVGWLWAPTAWAGRVLLWLVLWPLGLWRSIRHARQRDERRARRGY